MNRLAIMIVLIFTATVIGPRGTAIAFSLHWGQSQASDTYGTAQTASGAELPTPRLFIVFIGPKPTLSTLSFASPDDGTAQPNIRFQHPGMNRKTAASSTRNQLAATTAHRLNGAELFLLRAVQTMAER